MDQTGFAGATQALFLQCGRKKDSADEKKGATGCNYTSCGCIFAVPISLYVVCFDGGNNNGDRSR